MGNLLHYLFHMFSTHYLPHVPVKKEKYFFYYRLTNSHALVEVYFSQMIYIFKVSRLDYM